MKIRFLFFFLLIQTFLFAQSKREVIALDPSSQDVPWRSGPVALSLQEITPFLAYAIAWEGEAESVQIRFLGANGEWSAWQECARDYHEIEGETKKYSILGFAKPTVQKFQLSSDLPLSGVVFHGYSPGKSAEPSTADNPAISSRFCPCPLPGFQDREGWCPGGNCPPHPNPAFTNVTHLIIHHSAGSNVSSDWAAVVRSIWDFHVNTRGWSDIGYNWLIDPNGVIYEGRGNDWIGAHFCSTNSNTMGICMLGTFTNQLPEADAVQSLRELLAWKSCESDIDPLGSAFHPSSNLTLDQISGHRDGCATECPGGTFYATIPTLRQEVQDYLTNNCSSLAAPTDLTGSVQGLQEIDLTWIDNAAGETSYEVERAEGTGSDFMVVATLGADAESYTDQVPAPGVYGYRVRAMNAQETSAYSEAVTVNTDPSATAQLFSTANVQVFPNPVVSSLRLSLESPVTGELRVLLRNTGQQRVKEIQIPLVKGRVEQATLNMGDLPAGVYWLQLQHRDGQGIFRVVKY
jgi:hypothetical protein